MSFKQKDTITLNNNLKLTAFFAKDTFDYKLNMQSSPPDGGTFSSTSVDPECEPE